VPQAADVRRREGAEERRGREGRGGEGRTTLLGHREVREGWGEVMVLEGHSTLWLIAHGT